MHSRASSTSVSVALCTHNGATFLEEQLASILNQSAPVVEIVLSDDASVDGTVPLARAAVATYNAEHPDRAVELRVLQNEPALGVVKNFEQAALACTGDLVALCDQDDVWSQDRIERFVQEFAEHPQLLLAHSNATLIDEAGVPLEVSLFDALEISAQSLVAINAGRGFRELLHRNLVTGATTVVRRELMASAAPFPDFWVHDEWLGIVAAAFGGMRVVSEELTQYRQHHGNQIGAEKLSLLAKVGRLNEPRAERNKRLAGRASVLRERLAAQAGRVPANYLADTRRNERHQNFRLALSAVRWRRVLPVMSRAHDYARYSRGCIDMLRDIVQPAD